MKNANWIWTPEKLRSHLSHPAKSQSGHPMKYDGPSNPKQLDDLIAFLKTLH